MTRGSGLDLLLRSWMSEGADQAPERAVEDALRQVDRTGQRRPPVLATARRRMRAGPSTDHRVLAFSLVVAVVGVLLVSAGIQVGLIGPPQPNPGPNLPSPTTAEDTSEPAPTAGGFLTFEGPDGGFRIRLPDRWRQTNGPDRTALYLESDGLELSIRAADESGTLRTCDRPAGPWEECEDIQPRALDDLSDAIGLTSEAEEGVRPLGPLYESMTLDGEPASVISIEAYEYPARGAEFVKYVVAMHAGRPYIARFWTPLASGIPDATDLLDGFEFVRADPEPSAPESQRFVGPDGTFAISLPAGWHLATGADPSALYVTSPQAKLSISIRGGDAGGIVRTCDIAAAQWEVCSAVRPDSLDALADAIQLNESSPSPLMGPTASEVTLAGEPARTVAMVGPGGSTGSVGVRYVVAMHEGRPFVIRARGRGPVELPLALGPLLERFEFIAADPDPAPVVATPRVDPDGAFVSPDQTFAIRLPGGWELDTGPDPSALYLRNPATRLVLSIRGGDAYGKVLTCDTGVSSWETCALVDPGTLEDLAASIGLDADWPAAFIGPNESPVSLDGVPATSISIVASDTSGPTAVRYVVAMYEGRPFVVRATKSTPFEPHLGLMDLLDGFEFR